MMNGWAAWASSPGGRVPDLAERRAQGHNSRFMPAAHGGTMPAMRAIALLGLLLVGLAACDDKQAQTNTPTKPDANKLEPQTDQSAPNSQKR
jgi:hypothetical protein